MSKKDKIDKEYQDYCVSIEQAAEAEIKKIRERTAEIKKEAENIGSAVEGSLNDLESKRAKKKVNR